MAKIVSQKREIMVRDKVEGPSSPAVAMLGLVLTVLCVAGALVMAWMAFRVQP